MTFALTKSQERALAELDAAISAGERRICLTTPTGGGKTVIAMTRIERSLAEGKLVAFYSNRIMLGEQLFDRLDDWGLEYGIQQSGYGEAQWANLQAASIQTVATRLKRGRITVHPADEVWIDEVHENKADQAQDVMDAHLAANPDCVFIGMTATPLELAHLYSKLIVAGSTGELRDEGLLVPAITYAPDEITAKAYRNKHVTGLMQMRDEVREILIPVVYGSVRQHLLEYNPDLHPTLLFADSVPSSGWFAQRFWSQNIPAAHIDSDRIWINGETWPADREHRHRLREASESRKVLVTCNRFVMRTGIDWPHLRHGIFACTFGSPKTYLQAGGRLLRQLFVDGFPQLSHVTIQDHGGNYWRHDSLNADRVWSLDDTDEMVRARRECGMTDGRIVQPHPCPRCGRVFKVYMVQCPACGFISRIKVRRVIEADGRLRQVKGDVVSPRRLAAVSEDGPDYHRIWMQCVFRCRNARTPMTMGQARGLFMHENGGLSPGPDFPMMPREDDDWFLLVRDVFPPKPKGAKNG